MVTTNESDQNTNTEGIGGEGQLDASQSQEFANAAEVSVEEQNQVEEPAEAKDAPPEPGASPIPAVISSTTLFFLQPDLPPVLERAPRDDRGRARRQDDEPYERQERTDRSDRYDRQERTDRNERADRSDRGERSRESSRDDRRQAPAERTQSTTRRRQPREEQPAEEPVLITEPQKIKGSTRLEAKRQRRREGRESGRRRQVITESEFLARREAVDRVMLVRAKDDRVQIGVLEDKVLVEHYVARSQESSLIGNVYLGRVQNVLPSMEAAFIDIGRGRNAVLYSGEVDWAAAEVGGKSRRIENALKPGDRVLVQVTKDPIGHKGARLTSQVSLPGRYLVYVPGNSMNGISRKLPDTERARLKKILKETLPAGVGVIVRTAAEGATQDQLERDVNRLTAQWADISSRIEAGPAPALLHSEPDLLIKIIRDVFNEDFHKIVIQGSEELETITNYLRQVAPDLVDRVEAFQGGDVFAEYRATEHIEKALDRKVWLPSGGSLVIDRTEA
ncbi:MAG: ribonuclease E/G, partial [Pseudoclavibacter sp.]